MFKISIGSNLDASAVFGTEIIYFSELFYFICALVKSCFCMLFICNCGAECFETNGSNLFLGWMESSEAFETLPPCHLLPLQQGISLFIRQRSPHLSLEASPFPPSANTSPVSHVVICQIPNVHVFPFQNHRIAHQEGSTFFPSKFLLLCFWCS